MVTTCDYWLTSTCWLGKAAFILQHNVVKYGRYIILPLNDIHFLCVSVWENKRQRKATERILVFPVNEPTLVNCLLLCLISFTHLATLPTKRQHACAYTHTHTQKLIKHRTNMWPEDSQKQPWLITLSHPSSLHPNLFISVTHAYNAPTPLHPHAHLIAFAHRQLFWHTGNSCLQRYDSQTGCDSTEYECLRNFSLCVMYN